MIRKRPLWCVVCMLFLLTSSAEATASSSLSRRKCRNQLPSLDVRLNSFRPDDNEVYVIQKKDHSAYAVITPVNDKFVEKKRSGRKTYVYREDPRRAHYISNFEAEKLSLVIDGFIKALEDLETHIQKDNWGRCVYLDAYFPRFLQAFYYLCHAAAGAQNDILPAKAALADSLFDVSLTSPKSDARIVFWRDFDEHAIKMRIATKELVTALATWNDRFLKKKHVNKRAEIMHREKVGDAYALFVYLYFPKKTR